MALLNLQRLVKKDLFTETIWNNLMDILEAKFSGGVSESDLAWPLVAQGDIDFGQTYGIVGLRQLWGVVNAGEYANLEAAIAAAGGKAIFIPPDEEIPCSAATISTSDVTIFGAGPTSIIKITAASTGPMISTAAAGVSNFRIMNCTLDGTGAGAGCVGVKLQKATRPSMLNVHILGFTDDFIQVTNGGAAGDSSVDVCLDTIHCSGGSDKHLFVDDVQGIMVYGMVSKSAGGDAISMVPASSSHLIQDVVILGTRIQSGAGKGIRIVGSGAAGIVAHSRIEVSNCHAVSMTGLPFELGNTGALLKDTAIKNCFAISSASDGIRIASNGGSVTGNHVPSATGDGVDIQNSVDLWVHGNNCKSAGAYGVNAASSTTCVVVGNNCQSAATDGINRTSSTSLRALENVGDDAPTIGNIFADFTPYSKLATATGDIGFTYTIPANSFKQGDVLRIVIGASATVSSTVELRIGATVLSTYAFAANTTGQVVWHIRIQTGGSNTQVLRQIVRDTPSATTSTGNALIDWTVDEAITFNVSANGGDTSIAGIFIELLGSK